MAVRLWIYRVAIVVSVLLLALPNAVGLGSSGAAWRAALVPLWLAVVLCLPEAGRRISHLLRWARRPSSWALLAFLTVLLSGFIHGAIVSPAIPLASAVGLVMVWGTVIGFAVVGRLRWPSRTSEFLFLAGGSLAAFVAMNLAMSAFGMGSRGGGLWILGLIGVHGERLTFPMMRGPNSGGSIAGAAMAAAFLTSFAFLRRQSTIAAIALSGGLLSLAGVLLTDSRGGFLVALAVIGLVIALPSAMLGILQWLFVIPPLIPLFNWLAEDLTQGPGLSRLLGPLDRGGSFMARIATWRAALMELAHPRWIHLIGYGYKGDVASDVAQAAGAAVSPTRDIILGPHNVVLQYILDNGYIGAALFLFVLFLTIRRLARMAEADPRSGARPALGVMVYLALLGTIERVPTVYSPELFTVFLFIVIFTLFAPEDEKAAAGGADPDRPIESARAMEAA